MRIEILGGGCSKCKATEKIIRQVVEELGKEVEIVKVEDLQEIVNRGVIMTPAVFINSEVKGVGRIPTTEDIKKLLQKENLPIILSGGSNDITPCTEVFHYVEPVITDEDYAYLNKFLNAHKYYEDNWVEELKDKAEYITTDVNNYGLMNALKYYSLI